MPVLTYVLPLGVAVALSIFPVLAVVLMLLSRNPSRAGISYAIGWSLGLVILATAFAIVASLIPNDMSEPLPAWVHGAEIVVGALLVVQGTVSAVRERRRAKAVTPPAWLERARNLSAPRAFAFGMFMNVRPKNIALTLAAGLAIGAAQLSFLAGGVAVFLFMVVGVSSVVILVLLYLLAPQRAHRVLTFLSTWLATNASLVLRLSIILIGVFLVIVGIIGLA